uniref:WD repeat and coiled-coil-containing protein n=1 Tax=Crassostrea virginica TaxID=6565 RepID=A0A8B8AVZ9_CRAVI|nr:WD repeat and coiled-coil-containing protein-like [Crassostrea virginica]
MQFLYSHAQNRGSYALPALESGKFSCGAWSQDGTRLVLCVGAVILVYTWDDIDLSINSFTPSAWKIPGYDCSIRSVSLLSESLLVCATELPLESLCKNQDMFDAPTVFNGDNQSRNTESDVIMPKKQTSSQSITGTLFNLPRNPQSLIQETAQLVTIQLRENRDPHRKACVGLQGLLSPEILIYEPSLRSLVVGSNTQNVLQVFTFTMGGPAGDLVKSAEIHMDKLERPKGISLIPKGVAMGYKGVLIAAGAKNHSDSAFLPSSSGSNMDVKLKFYPIDVDLEQIHSEKEMNESAESSESVCSSLSSLESPRQQNKINMEEENAENLGDKDQNENSVPKQEIVGAELYLPKQKTRTELCDPSDTDSEASPREVTPYSEQNNGTEVVDPEVVNSVKSEQPEPEKPEPVQPEPKMVLTDLVSTDNDSVSPREISLFSSSRDSSRPKIVDLSKSESIESDLETDKVDFCEQEARFRNSFTTEDIEEVLDEVAGVFNPG